MPLSSTPTHPPHRRRPRTWVVALLALLLPLVGIAGAPGVAFLAGATTLESSSAEEGGAAEETTEARRSETRRRARRRRPHPANRLGRLTGGLRRCTIRRRWTATPVVRADDAPPRGPPLLTV